MDTVYSIAVISGVENMTDLTKIPGIGKNMAQHLIRAGYPDIESLKGQDPAEVYQRDCLAQGAHVDRCAL
ncbi:MAG: helix-hairpin-helix domain-containing protein, partial [Clostridiales bacterium]|nr:helix-hairpin-helix domain-containing protein [Clostridiales bacterium]